VLRDDLPSAVSSIKQFQKAKIERRMVAGRYRQENNAIYQAKPLGIGH